LAPDNWPDLAFRFNLNTGNKSISSCIAALTRPVAQNITADFQIFFHGQMAKDAAALRHESYLSDDFMRHGKNLSPFHSIEPLVIGTKPKIAFSTVDLPAPFGPIKATTSPAVTLTLTPCSTCKLPYEASTSF